MINDQADKSTTMKAWLSDKPEIKAVELTELTRPSPGEGEILVRVEAAALNFSDLLMLRDQYQIRPPRPFVPGQEICGIIEDVGTSTGFATGLRVSGKVVWGGFAEYALLRADMAFNIPVKMPPIEAAALPISYTTAMMALDCCGNLQPGQTVLVHSAAGGLGLASVQLAIAKGAIVYGTAGSKNKQRLVLANGAKAVFNSRDLGWHDQVIAATGGNGIDLVLDTIGGAATLESIRALSYGGKVLIAGFLSGEIPQIPGHRLLLKRASAIGVYWSHDKKQDQDLLAEYQKKLIEMYRKKTIQPHIGGVFAFSNLPDALEMLEQGRATGKLVVEIK